MSDIVERLRKYGPHPKDSAFRIHDEAADEIERLCTSNAELLALLKQIVADCEHLKDSNDSEGETIFDKARATIEKAGP